MLTLNKPHFFNTVRKSLFGGQLSQDQVTVLETIIDVFAEDGLSQSDSDLDQLAYVLATPYHEVGRDLDPKSENLNYTAKRLTAVWPARFKTAAAAAPYAHNPEALANKVYGGRFGNGPEASGDGWRYRGRGFVQITFRDNYKRLGDAMGIDLVGNPDLALNRIIAAKILVTGMIAGYFTGKALSDYFRPGKADFVNARRIINNDAAANGERVATYARKFRAALKFGDPAK